jgi:PKD repeat protein
MGFFPVHRVLAAAVLAALAGVSGAAAADVIVPSSAYLTNSLGDDFRTDVRVFNPTNAPVQVTPVFYRQTNAALGIPADTITAGSLTIPARGQVAIDNVLASLFGEASGVSGPIRFQTPVAIQVSSATSNVNGCNHTGAVQGQWIPGLDVADALTAGTLLQLAASTDLVSGYRSNVVFFHPGDATSATVTANLRRGDGTLVSGASFALGTGPAGFKQINRFSTEFAPPVSLVDTNLFLEFTSSQPVLAFASVINNVSGDPFALSAVGDPAAPPPPPVASFTVSANPTAGQPVTFTSTATNGPTSFMWSFGDGSAPATATSAATTHTFAASTTDRTYSVVHFAASGSGASGASSDVVVKGVPPAVINLTIQASQFSWSPATTTLRVGQPYQITFQNNPAQPTVRHGVGGLAALGVPADCNLLNPSCVWTITPTSAQAAFNGGVYQFGCVQTSCGSGHTGMTAGAVNGGTITITP